MKTIRLLAFLSMLVGCAVAHGALVLVTGNITRGDSTGTFFVGQEYTMLFDWIGPGPNSAPPIPYFDLGNYNAAGTSLIFNVPGYSVRGTVVQYVLIQVPGSDNTQFDRVGVQSANFLSASGPETPLVGSQPLSGRIPFFVGIELSDDTGSALSSVELLAPVFDLSDFARRELTVAFAGAVHNYGANDVISVYGDVRSMTLLIPEPGTMTLLGVGMIFLITVRCRRVAMLC